MSENNRVAVKCNDCGINITISKNTYYQNKNKNHQYRCKSCYSKYRSSVSKRIWRDMSDDRMRQVYTKAALTRRNKSEEEKSIIRNKTQETWKNKSSEEMENYKHDCAKRTTQFWNNLSDEQRSDMSRKSSEAQKLYLSNMSDDEYDLYIKSRSEAAKRIWSKMTKDDRDKIIHNMSEGTKRQWELISDKERESISNKISIGRKIYWDNMSDEERIKFGKKHKEWWDSLSDEERELQFIPMRIGYRNWYENLSDEDKQNISERVSKTSKNYWDNMTSEEKDKWMSKRLDGFNKYFSTLNVIPNKNESSFINYMNLYQIHYQYQYYNLEKHPDFDKLFPNNPVTGATIVLPYHSWDFILYLREGNILVDIDGSIHDQSKSNFNVTSYNGKHVSVKDIIKFNDSQRPYQTDGLPAYVIQCYDDNLTNDTPVLDINSNEIISFKSFISLLILMNMNDNEIKEFKKLINSDYNS